MLNPSSTHKSYDLSKTYQKFPFSLRNMGRSSHKFASRLTPAKREILTIMMASAPGGTAARSTTLHLKHGYRERGDGRRRRDGEGGDGQWQRRVIRLCRQGRENCRSKFRPAITDVGKCIVFNGRAAEKIFRDDLPEMYKDMLGMTGRGAQGKDDFEPEKINVST